jgi:hypothetical protein
LARKRKIHANPPPVGKKRSQTTSTGKRNYDPKKVSPSERVREFPGEHLTVSSGKLFCKACRESLVLKKSVLVSHVKSTKHECSKQKLLQNQSSERDIADALAKHDGQTHRKGETLDEESKVYRVKVLMAFMKAGIPLEKLECQELRDLLQENGYRLTDARHMRDLVPFIHQQEQDNLKTELKGRDLSITFDGTSRLGEVLAVVVRFVYNWTIQERLVRLKFLTKSMNGEELARELITVLSIKLSLESHQLLAVMRDRASVNGAALNIVKIMYPNLLDVGCLSHMLNLVGERFKTPTLSLFIAHWIALFSHSYKVKALWKEATGRAMASYSKTRWWSRWELMNQVMVQFAFIEPFLQNNEDIGPATRAKLLEILSHPPSMLLLKVELAAVIDLGEHFVKGTYRLEGDGYLVLSCYEEILKIRNAIRIEHYPNLQAIVRQAFPDNNDLQKQWVAYSIGCLQAGLDYFQNKLGNDSQLPVAAFKAARLFSPFKVNEIQPTAKDVDDLMAFPFLVDEIDHLKAELPAYLALAADVNADVNILEWWKNHSSPGSDYCLPHWSSAVQKVLLVQPSSAAAERVFSMLNQSFGEQQQNALEDLVETTIMLQCNKR